jgi:hypothetical protein
VPARLARAAARDASRSTRDAASDTPAAERTYVPLHRRGIRMAAEHDPYTGLLVSMRAD